MGRASLSQKQQEREEKLANKKAEPDVKKAEPSVQQATSRRCFGCRRLSFVMVP